MNRYKVEVRTDTVVVVEGHSESEAEQKVFMLAWPLTGCCEGIRSSRVTVIRMTNLSDPVTLVADLACQLQWRAFRDGICEFCGGGELDSHAKDCVLGRARHFLDQSK